MAHAEACRRAGWLRIGQLAEATGETTKTLRFYDDAGVLTATTRSPAGYRLYAPSMIERVALVRAGQAAGLRL
ncbi:MAG: MerR family DNA-binding transcriptional regulator, partial [Acidimicrobiales bacterium]